VSKLSKAELDALVGEAIVDCYDREEQLAAFYTMIQDNLATPFQTQVLGLDVIVKDVDLRDDAGVVAICARGAFRQAVPILDLPLPVPRPEGVEWIDAYRHWLG
jgi:Calcium binding